MTTVSPVDEAQPSNRARLLAVGEGIGLFAAAFVTLIAGVVAVLVAFGPEGLESVRGVVVNVVVGKLLLVAIAYPYVRWRLDGLPVSTPDRDESILIGIAIVVSVVAAIGLTFLRERLVSADTTSPMAELMMANPSLVLIIGGLSVVLIAPAEELVFRGAVQDRLRSAFGPWAAIGGGSLLFGAFHLLNFTGSLVGILLSVGVIGTVSLLWGYAYERTRNFAVPALTHGLYNLTLMLITYVTL